MTADERERIIVELERTKGALSAHEQICAERYRQIGENTAAINASIAGSQGETRAQIAALRQDFSNLTRETAAATNGAAAGINQRLLAVAAAIIMLLIGALAWTGGQLYALEPVRVKHETKK